MKASCELLYMGTSVHQRYRRTCLILLLLAMCLYTFQREENQYLFIYTTFKFNWEVNVYSIFKTFKSTAYVLAMLVSVPVMNRFFHWRDTVRESYIRYIYIYINIILI